MSVTNPLHRTTRSAGRGVLRPRIGLGVALGVALLTALAAAAEPVLTVVEGSVEIGRGDPALWAGAQTGDVVRAGESVRTGPQARAEVDLGTGVVRLYENSLLRIPADAMRAEGPAAVGLDEGSSLFEVLKRAPTDPFEVRTPEVVASVKGTRFGVALQGSIAAVSVYTGLVGVRGVGASPSAEVLVREGFSAVGGPGRPFDLMLRPAVDPWGSWKSGAPPPPAPDALPKPPPAEGEVTAARAAALRAAGPEVLDEVIARHPELQRGDSKEAAKADADSKRQDGAAASMPIDVLDPAPALSGEAVIDPVTTRTKLESEGGDARAIREQVAEVILNGGGTSALPGGASLGSLGLVARVELSGSTQHQVILSGVAGNDLAALDTTKLQQIASGAVPPSALGGQLLSVLATHNVSPTEFAKFLLGTLNH
jgi:ferric-dicitrate binding protein FerR (iron transport regulator)